MFAVMWTVVGLLFVVWSAMAWGLHMAVQWLAGLAPDQLEAAATATGDAAREAALRLGIPGWINDILPPGIVEFLLTSSQTLLFWLQSMILEAPALVGWLSPAIVILWGLGTLLLLLVGTAIHMGLRLFAGRRSPLVTAVQR